MENLTTGYFDKKKTEFLKVDTVESDLMVTEFQFYCTILR
jgi:hypothetical protein